MAAAAARVPEGTAGGRDELPVVGRLAQRELEHAPGARDRFAGAAPPSAWLCQGCPACPDYELTNAAGGVGDTIDGLRRESLVQVVVCGDHDVGVEVLQRPP